MLTVPSAAATSGEAPSQAGPSSCISRTRHSEHMPLGHYLELCFRDGMRMIILPLKYSFPTLQPRQLQVLPWTQLGCIWMSIPVCNHKDCPLVSRNSTVELVGLAFQLLDMVLEKKKIKTRVKTWELHIFKYLCNSRWKPMLGKGALEIKLAYYRVASEARKQLIYNIKYFSLLP